MHLPSLPKIPDITGRPKLDTALRAGIIAISASATGAMVGFLDAKGFHADWVWSFAPLIFVTLLIVVVTYIWAIISKNALVVGIIDHLIDAAETGEVSAQVQQLATPEQVDRLKEATAQGKLALSK